MKHKYNSEMFCPESSVGEDDGSSVLYQKTNKNLIYFLFQISQMKSGHLGSGSAMRVMLKWTIFT